MNQQEKLIAMALVVMASLAAFGIGFNSKEPTNEMKLTFRQQGALCFLGFDGKMYSYEFPLQPTHCDAVLEWCFRYSPAWVGSNDWKECMEKNAAAGKQGNGYVCRDENIRCRVA